jgi:hypothetical protein
LRTTLFLQWPFLAGLCVFASAERAIAQEGAPVGINLSEWTNYHPEWVFVDAFKGASEWVSQRIHGGPWDDQRPIARGVDGYPASLDHDQAVAAVMFKDIDGRYPGGRYVVLWDGDGDIDLRDDARERTRSRNRIEADVRPRDGIILRIVRTNPSDPVRNVRVLMPGFESTHQTSPFHPQFLANWRGFPLLRFMNWARTGNDQSDWSGRPTPTTYSQATRQGVAAEYMIDLSNELDADPWFCLPHRATDEYARELGRLIAARLEPGRRIYLEYSNECWNNLFPQAQWCRGEGLRLQLSADPFEAQLRFYSQRAVELLRIVRQQLPATTEVVRVLAAQNASPWTSEAILGWRDAWRSVEALAVAPYFGDELGHPSYQDQVSRWSVEEVLAQCWMDLEPTFRATAAHALLARQHRLAFLGYEGGQHLAGYGGAENNRQLTELFIAANRHAAMGVLYTAFLNRWALLGGGPMAAYHSTGKPSRWGSWGTLEWAAQDPTTAPKYLALRVWLTGWRVGF